MGLGWAVHPGPYPCPYPVALGRGLGPVVVGAQRLQVVVPIATVSVPVVHVGGSLGAALASGQPSAPVSVTTEHDTTSLLPVSRQPIPPGTTHPLGHGGPPPLLPWSSHTTRCALAQWRVVLRAARCNRWAEAQRLRT
jgi:hypothetical protein